MKTRKGVRIMALFLCAAIAMTACSVRQEEPEPEKKVLELWTYWDFSYTRQALSTVVSEFNKDHPDMEVVIQYIPDEDFKKRLALGMADGTMPDIAIVDSSDVQFFNSTGRLVNLSQIVDTDDYLNTALASCRSGGGKLSGVPVGISCLVFYYNNTLLQQADLSVPRNLDEFVYAAKKLSGNNIYGCAFPALQSEESLFCFLPILWSEGGSVTALNTEKSRRAFDVLRQLSASGAMSHKTVDMTLADVEREFKKGNIAMMFSTTMSLPKIQEDNPQLDFGVGPLPLGEENTSVVGGEVITVQDGEYQEEAKEFVRYFCDSERMKGYINEMGYLAPRKDILEWQIANDTEKQKFADILNGARTRDFTRDWPQVSLAVSDTISKVILQEDTTETFDQLVEKIHTIRGGAQ